MHIFFLLHWFLWFGYEPKPINDEITFTRANPNITKVVSKLFKYVRIFFNYSCFECFLLKVFFILHRLKNYLRSTLVPKRLDNISLLHKHNSKRTLRSN